LDLFNGFNGLSRGRFAIRTQRGPKHLLPAKSICQAGSQGHHRGNGLPRNPKARLQARTIKAESRCGYDYFIRV
jgi:hypothetical protein